MGLGPGLLVTGFEDPGNKIRVHSVWAEVEVGMEGRGPALKHAHLSGADPGGSNVSSGMLFLKALWGIEVKMSTRWSAI